MLLGDRKVMRDGLNDLRGRVKDLEQERDGLRVAEHLDHFTERTAGVQDEPRGGLGGCRPRPAVADRRDPPRHQQASDDPARTSTSGRQR